MTDRNATATKILALIEPFNKKGIDVTEATRFAQDLEWDSLTVLDFVANIEDEYDILITMSIGRCRRGAQGRLRWAICSISFSR